MALVKLVRICMHCVDYLLSFICLLLWRTKNCANNLFRWTEGWKFRYDPTTDTYQQFIAKPTTEEQIFIESVFSMVAVDDKTLWLGRGWDFAKLDLETKKITSIFEIPERVKMTGDVRKSRI